MYTFWIDSHNVHPTPSKCTSDPKKIDLYLNGSDAHQFLLCTIVKFGPLAMPGYINFRISSPHFTEILTWTHQVREPAFVWCTSDPQRFGLYFFNVTPIESLVMVFWYLWWHVKLHRKIKFTESFFWEICPLNVSKCTSDLYGIAHMEPHFWPT